MARWHSCNVLQVGADARRLWQFDAHGGDFTLNREHSTPAGEPLPAGTVKTWSSLWQPRLNVAWLPPESVFLRVVHLPKSGFDETLAMVELQLEKLSPFPVTQVVWSVQPLSRGTGDLQTLIVVFAERKAVEDFLGQLEGQGYLADRLELPTLDQLQATAVNEDGAWFYPGAWGGKNAALVAWWYGGDLQNLNFVVLTSANDRAADLKAQLAHMTWAGEMEGWLTGPPAWHLVADEATAKEWEPILRQGLDEPIVRSAPLAPAQLAALTAKRAAQTEQKANLLPVEFATRYQQQLVDRLWMRGLLTVASLYGVVVVIYFVALGFLTYQTTQVENAVQETNLGYTNAAQLKAVFQVLKDRQELKFGALDCWKAVAELAPASVTLENFAFSGGRKLVLSGTVSADGVAELIEFGGLIRKATANGQPLFDPAKGDPLNYQVRGATATWSLGLELKRTQEP